MQVNKYDDCMLYRNQHAVGALIQKPLRPVQGLCVSVVFGFLWFQSSGFRPGFTPPCLVLESVFPCRQKPPCHKLACQFQIVCCRASWHRPERDCPRPQATRSCEPGPSRNKVFGIAARPLQQDVSSISRGGSGGG